MKKKTQALKKSGKPEKQAAEHTIEIEPVAEMTNVFLTKIRNRRVVISFSERNRNAVGLERNSVTIPTNRIDAALGTAKTMGLPAYVGVQLTVNDAWAGFCGITPRNWSTANPSVFANPNGWRACAMNFARPRIAKARRTKSSRS
jgi:hypothetical protein